jgi:hypothetical protein
MPVRLHVLALAFVLPLVNARARLVSVVHPARLVRLHSLVLHARPVRQAAPPVTTAYLERAVVFPLPVPMPRRHATVSMAFAAPTGSARATLVGPPHPTALNALLALPDSSSMGTATVQYVNWVANHALTGAGSASRANKALPRMPMIVPNATPCSL